MSIEDAMQDLNSKIGTELHVGQWMEMTQDRINQFADVTEDHQWIHVDPARASVESPYGATVAHGFLTLSLTPFLTESVNPDKPLYPDVKMGVNYGLNRVRFPHPVKDGDRIRTRTELQQVEQIKGAIQTVNKITVEIEGQEKPGCVAEMVLRLYF
jgi:acyl dehydratase